jgi:methylenetetrahydrofolate dehydrogenase (NADP+)/methenyltetrahydrofolate cyclohydrolase
MKFLNGADLADFIKERQGHESRALRQADHVIPTLAIIQTTDNPVIDSYVRLKQRYADDIGIDVRYHRISQQDIRTVLQSCNDDPSIHGIIIQLPLDDPSETDKIVNLIDPAKDVDALGEQAQFDPATATAIHWLLNGYNIELKGKHIVIIGKGRLVGKPLEKLWLQSNLDVTSVDIDTKDKDTIIKSADIIVTATGAPGSLTSELIAIDSVVVDAGTASEYGKLVGDVAEDVRTTRDDLTITPLKGGVGPLTITALFENVLRSARLAAITQD